MTPSMIVWTLDLLDWVREQLGQFWPEARLRGGETDIDPEPYRIRLRDSGKQYWLFLSPDAIRGIRVEEVISLLEESNWIPAIKTAGGLSVGVEEGPDRQPVLLRWPALGPEVKAETAA